MENIDLEFFKNHIFWIAVGSMGTFIMAMATFATLWSYQKDKKEKENREVSERISGPLMGDLEDIKRQAKSHSDFRSANFRWKGLRNVEGYLSSKLPKDLRNSFDEFDDFFEEKERKFFIEQKNINSQNLTNRYDEIYNQADKLKNKIEQYQKKNL